MNPPNAPASPVVEDLPTPGRQRPLLIGAAVAAVVVLVVAAVLARRTDGISGAVAPSTVDPVTTAALTTAAPVTTGAALSTTVPSTVSAVPPPGASTTIVTVSPFGGDGRRRADLHVTEELTGGDCTAGGSALVQGAARCFAGNSVLDPCWSEPGSGSGLCLENPWSTNAYRLPGAAGLRGPNAETGLAGRPGAPDLDRPWGVELATGERCVQMTGAHGVIGDDVVDYQCRDDLVLLRGLDRTGAMWTARTATCCAEPRPGPAVVIRTAWYGGA